MFEAFQVALAAVWNDSGFVGFQTGQGIMILVGLLLYIWRLSKATNRYCSARSRLAASWQIFRPTKRCLPIRES